MFEQDVLTLQGPSTKAAFVAAIYEGDNIMEACARLRLNPGALGLVRRQDETFDMAIRDAQACRIDMKVDGLETIHEEIEDPLMCRVVSDNIKWVAAKRKRDIYGEKVDVTVTERVDLKQAMIDARKRTINYIDVTPLETLDNETDIKSVEVADAAQLDDVDPLS